MMERQKNNVWPFAHLEGIHHYQNISFHKLLQLLELEKKQSEELLLQLWKIVLMARIQIFKVTQKIRGKIWAIILYHMFIHFVLVPKERFHCGQAIAIFLSKIYLVSNSILLCMTVFLCETIIFSFLPIYQNQTHQEQESQTELNEEFRAIMSCLTNLVTQDPRNLLRRKPFTPIHRQTLKTESTS